MIKIDYVVRGLKHNKSDYEIFEQPLKVTTILVLITPNV